MKKVLILSAVFFIILLQTQAQSAFFTSDSPRCFNDTVHFTPAAPSGTILQEKWDFGDGSPTSTSKTVTHESKDVEFDFPLYWATGALMRWTDRFYTTTDISQTQWSGYSYTASGQSSVNPLDGNPSGQSKLDDCWAIRQGAEYLLPMKDLDICG